MHVLRPLGYQAACHRHVDVYGAAATIGEVVQVKACHVGPSSDGQLRMADMRKMDYAAKCIRLVSLQQRKHLGDVITHGHGADDGVHLVRLHVHAKPSLRPKSSPVVFFVQRLEGTLTAAAFAEKRCCNQGSIHAGN
jgi:hypothetical protein